MPFFIKLQNKLINPTHLITLRAEADQKAIRVETIGSIFYIYYPSVAEMEADFAEAAELLV